MTHSPKSSAASLCPDRPDHAFHKSGQRHTPESAGKLPFFMPVPTVPTVPTIFYNTRRALAW